MSKHSQVLIIGSGPAAYTAGIYTGRAKLSTTILAGEQPGGQLMWTTDIENFPGFPNGKSGQDLMMDMQQQAERFGAEIQYEYATTIDTSSQPFKVWNNMPEGVFANDVFTGKKSLSFKEARAFIMKQEPAYTADSIILAVGATSVMLNVEGETEFLGKGVSTCAVCDAAFYKDKDTFVVGGGDSAMEDTLALTKFAKSVTVIHRRDAFKASKIMQERVLSHKKVKVLWNSSITSIKGSNKVETITVNQNDKEIELKADGVFIAIGHRPSTAFLQGIVALDDHGYILTRMSLSDAGLKMAKKATKENLIQFPTCTSIEGIFASGDSVDVRYKQAITAAGMGCMSAIDAERWLENR